MQYSAPVTAKQLTNNNSAKQSSDRTSGENAPIKLTQPMLEDMYIHNMAAWKCPHDSKMLVVRWYIEQKINTGGGNMIKFTATLCGKQYKYPNLLNPIYSYF